MRKFSSYGPIDTDLHYYVPRQGLIDAAIAHLLGEDPTKGGHYITVWAPRQRGKSWIMQQAMWRIRTEPVYAGFDVLKLNLEHLKMTPNVVDVIGVIAEELCRMLGLPPLAMTRLDDFYTLFRRETLAKPLILILDEFDALAPEAISGIVGVFRNIYNSRRDELGTITGEKEYLLHGVALIGVRSVLGVENRTGSSFNVQRSLHIPNLTLAEVAEMFAWYSSKSGQVVEPAVIDRLYDELRGQPGLTSWFGELLTETYNDHNPSITLDDFQDVYAAATHILPNANILNILSKAKTEPYRDFVFELFQTHDKIEFKYDDPRINYLYLNGVIDEEVVNKREFYVRFPCPFVHKRLFNHFADELFRQLGQVEKPFEDLDDTVSESYLHVGNLLRRYEQYLRENRHWLFQDAPRKSDLRLYEAVYHFNLYRYLADFLDSYGGRVHPEFPTGNGQIDLLIQHAGLLHGLELKSFTNRPDYQRALRQAAAYGGQLGLGTIWLVLFVDAVDDASRARYEAPYFDPQANVTVQPVFVATLA